MPQRTKGTICQQKDSGFVRPRFLAIPFKCLGPSAGTSFVGAVDAPLFGDSVRADPEAPSHSVRSAVATEDH
eukprot:1601373-Amphidinium_carterae.1